MMDGKLSDVAVCLHNCRSIAESFLRTHTDTPLSRDELAAWVTCVMCVGSGLLCVEAGLHRDRCGEFSNELVGVLGKFLGTIVHLPTSLCDQKIV